MCHHWWPQPTHHQMALRRWPLLLLPHLLLQQLPQPQPQPQLQRTQRQPPLPPPPHLVEVVAGRDELHKGQGRSQPQCQSRQSRNQPLLPPRGLLRPLLCRPPLALSLLALAQAPLDRSHFLILLRSSRTTASIGVGIKARSLLLFLVQSPSLARWRT